MALIDVYCENNIGYTGNWVSGYRCPGGFFHIHFTGNIGYNLERAKEVCAHACDARNDCHFASLRWTNERQDCYLTGANCGDWRSDADHLYHLYRKGMYSKLFINFPKV